MRALSLLCLTFSLVACDGCNPFGPVDDGPCGFGERLDPVQGCIATDHFEVNLDERRDETGNGTRSGIGVVACSYRATTTAASAESGSCALFSFDGRVLADAFAGDVGAIEAHLPEAGGDPDDPTDPYGLDRVLMLPTGESCYDTDLHPSRGDLFDTGEDVQVVGHGGEDFGSFDVTLRAPAPLEVEEFGAIDRGESFKLKWEPGDGDHVVVLLQSYDAQEDHTSNILCFFDDDGSGTIAGSLTAGLEGVSTGSVFMLRQDWSHLESDEVDTVVDITLTASLTRDTVMQ